MLRERKEHINIADMNYRAHQPFYENASPGHSAAYAMNESSTKAFEDRGHASIERSRRCRNVAPVNQARLSEVLEGEPQNLHPNWAVSTPAIQEGREKLLLMKPKDRFKAQKQSEVVQNDRNLRFNIGGPPSWQRRLIRGDRPTPRRRQLLQRVLVSASTLEANSRHMNKFASSSFADKDQMVKNRDKTIGQSKGPISALNSLGVLSESHRGENGGTGQYGVNQASGKCCAHKPGASAGNEKSKFRSTVIPSIKLSSKFRPSLNIFEGGGDDFVAENLQARDQCHERKYTDYASQLKEDNGKIFHPHSFGNFMPEEIKEISEPPSISQRYRELIEKCRSLDQKSFEQSEEFILELEGVIESIFMNGNVAGIIKEILDCGNEFVNDYIIRCMIGRVEHLAQTRQTCKVLRLVLSEKKNSDSKAELVKAELESFLLVEKKSFLLATYLRTAPTRARSEVLLKLMMLFRQDKPQIRESAATLINELLLIVPPEEADKAVSNSWISLEDIYFLPYSNYFIKNLLSILGPENKKKAKEYTVKNLNKLCNHQKSSRIIELVFESLGDKFCDFLLMSLLQGYFAECKKAEESPDWSNCSESHRTLELCKRELKQFRPIVAHQYGNFTLKSLYKNASTDFKKTYSKYIYRIKKYDPDLFSHFYASHFFNYFKKAAKDT